MTKPFATSDFTSYRIEENQDGVIEIIQEIRFQVSLEEARGIIQFVEDVQQTNKAHKQHWAGNYMLDYTPHVAGFPCALVYCAKRCMSLTVATMDKLRNELRFFYSAELREKKGA